MAEIVRLPSFSENQNKAVIVKWLKKEGEEVKLGESLVEFETDKSIIVIEAESEGVLLYIKVPVGEVEVGDILCVIGEKGEKASEVLSEIQTTEQQIDKAHGLDVIRLPKLSDMMEMARIVKWNIKAGDYLKKGDIFAEVETDKSVIEIESFREGWVLYTRPEEQPEVNENDILVILGEKGMNFQHLLENIKEE